jgi:hypothetical protein
MSGAFDLGEMHGLLPGLRKRNLDSPPDEVLRRIFGYIQCSADITHPELLITSVTHHWRELAIKIPSLWTTVSVNHDREISVLEAILSRSQNLPLSIYIRLDAFKYRFITNYMAAIDLLVPHVARWRLLSIIATNPVLHLLTTQIHVLPLTALEHLELVQSDTGHIQHFGPFTFEPAVFRTLRLERAMMYPADASLLARLTHIELKESSLAMLDEHKLLSLDYPPSEARTPSILALQHLVLDASNPVPDRGMPYSPAFSAAHLTTLSLTRLAAPSMDRVQALSRFFGTALAAPALHHLTIADIHGHALVMLLSVIRAATFPHLDRLALASIDTSGVDERVIGAFTEDVAELVLARLDPAPLFRHLLVPAVWPTLRRIELDGVEVPRAAIASEFGLD